MARKKPNKSVHQKFMNGKFTHTATVGKRISIILKGGNFPRFPLIFFFIFRFNFCCCWEKYTIRQRKATL
jgi:hypothetical protein